MVIHDFRSPSLSIQFNSQNMIDKINKLLSSTQGSMKLLTMTGTKTFNQKSSKKLQEDSSGLTFTTAITQSRTQCRTISKASSYDSVSSESLEDDTSYDESKSGRNARRNIDDESSASSSFVIRRGHGKSDSFKFRKGA